MEKDDSVLSSPARFRWRFIYLLIVILVLYVIGPFIEELSGFTFFVDICFSAVILLCIYAISEKRYQVIIAIALSIPMLLSLWLENYITYYPIIIIGQLCGIALFAFVVSNILFFIFKQKEVAADLVTGAAVAYLLMAVMWAFIYALIENLQPGSFTATKIHVGDPRYLYLYYSFVTITTLGYGDITPLSRFACSFSALEAVTGQLFLVIGVAWLVGLHASETMRKRFK